MQAVARFHRKPLACGQVLRTPQEHECVRIFYIVLDALPQLTTHLKMSTYGGPAHLWTCNGFFQDTPRQPQNLYVVYKQKKQLPHVSMLGESRPELAHDFGCPAQPMTFSI